MAETDIEWASHVWNFVRGCRRVSLGCGGPRGEGGCYAEKTAYRFSGPGMPYEGLVTLGANGPRWTGKGLFVPEKLDYPIHVRAPKDGSRHRFFVNSMSDLFFEEFSNEQIAAAFGVMAACPQHDFLILTKRPERAIAWYGWFGSEPNVARLLDGYSRALGVGNFLRLPPVVTSFRWPLPNVWIGVSVENQETANERIPLLLDTPSAIRFVSYEPALGPVNFCAVPDKKTRPAEWSAKYSPLGDLDWVIVGGESGPGARPFDLKWARRTVANCKEAGVPVFVKQFGRFVVDSDRKAGVFTEHDKRSIEAARSLATHCAPNLVLLKHRKGADLSEIPGEWPRQFPKGAV